MSGVIALGYLATTNRYENIQIVTPQTPAPGALAETPAPTEAPVLSPNSQATPVELSDNRDYALLSHQKAPILPRKALGTRSAGSDWIEKSWSDHL